MGIVVRGNPHRARVDQCCATCCWHMMIHRTRWLQPAIICYDTRCRRPVASAHVMPRHASRRSATRRRGGVARRNDAFVIVAAVIAQDVLQRACQPGAARRLQPDGGRSILVRHAGGWCQARADTSPDASTAPRRRTRAAYSRAAGARWLTGVTGSPVRDRQDICANVAERPRLTRSATRAISGSAAVPSLRPARCAPGLLSGVAPSAAGCQSVRATGPPRPRCGVAARARG